MINGLWHDTEEQEKVIVVKSDTKKKKKKEDMNEQLSLWSLGIFSILGSSERMTWAGREGVEVEKEKKGKSSLFLDLEMKSLFCRLYLQPQKIIWHFYVPLVNRIPITTTSWWWRPNMDTRLSSRSMHQSFQGQCKCAISKDGALSHQQPVMELLQWLRYEKVVAR